MNRILAPHKEQDGWVYVRVKRMTGFYRSFFTPYRRELTGAFPYGDNYPTERIISSRRVEEAVETADYLKLCAKEGLEAIFAGDGGPYGWMVAETVGVTPAAEGRTLREAYHRYKATL